MTDELSVQYNADNVIAELSNAYAEATATILKLKSALAITNEQLKNLVENLPDEDSSNNP